MYRHTDAGHIFVPGGSNALKALFNEQVGSWLLPLKLRKPQHKLQLLWSNSTWIIVPHFIISEWPLGGVLTWLGLPHGRRSNIWKSRSSRNV
jgi:hypothetical protein